MTTKSRRRKTKPVTVTKPVDVGVFEIVLLPFLYLELLVRTILNRFSPSALS